MLDSGSNSPTPTDGATPNQTSTSLWTRVRSALSASLLKAKPLFTRFLTSIAHFSPKSTGLPLWEWLLVVVSYTILVAGVLGLLRKL